MRSSVIVHLYAFEAARKLDPRVLEELVQAVRRTLKSGEAIDKLRARV